MRGRLVLSQDEALQAVAFLVTAARALLDEPVDYGPMRLLSAARRICTAAAPRTAPEVAAWLRHLAEVIPTGLRDRLRDPQAYRVFLDELCRMVAEGLLQWLEQEGPA